MQKKDIIATLKAGGWIVMDYSMNMETLYDSTGALMSEDPEPGVFQSLYKKTELMYWEPTDAFVWHTEFTKRTQKNELALLLRR